jgi:hypothetical protein
MADFTFSSGLPGLDSILGSIIEGDNVVLQVEGMGDYLPFVQPFVEWANAEGKDLVYFRFAPHAPVLPPKARARVVELKPEEGFEPFITEILEVAEETGYGACYVFDCLSDLSVDWYSDRMLGNFFMIACPYLYELKTVAYFALIKDHHDSFAVSAIHNTAQVVLDILRSRDRLYVQPLKVDGRSSRTMYFLHAWEGKDFVPVTDSATISEMRSTIGRSWTDFAVNRRDIWIRTFQDAEEGSACREGGIEDDALKRKLLKMLITRDERLLTLAERHFSLKDLVAISRRMIGTGLIGGKSAGMLVARSILLKRDPRYEALLEVHDSFFLGSDVFYTFIIKNGCWWDRHRIRETAPEHADTQAIQEKILKGSFPDEIVAQFSDMLQYFGQSPIIVRSSSLLEDAYGNAFSGKYESVFCPNQGSPTERLAALQDAIRRVYASTLSRDALVYRSRRGLLEQDEQMAILIQRVSGAFYGELYFPQLAGVGFSFNPYVWHRDIDPESGVARLVFGLGTRAVDRSDDDYTLLVALNAPELRVEGLAGRGKRYMQKRVDLLDLESRSFRTMDFRDVAAKAGDFNLSLFASRDFEAERYARERGVDAPPSWELSFDALLKGPWGLIPELKKMLRILEEAYEYPVDVEFTVNFKDESSWRLNLVQCRPFQVRHEVKTLDAPGQARDPLVATKGPVIGASAVKRVDALVHVVPRLYGALPTPDRFAVARLVGRVCRHEALDGKVIMLSGPGRWATSMPELGIPVSFSEISRAQALLEIAKMHEGLIPDVSLGTHFFNDLVELDMIYLAVYPDREGSVLDEARIEALPNRLAELLPDEARWADVLRLGIPGKGEPGIILSADSFKQEASLAIAGALA